MGKSMYHEFLFDDEQVKFLAKGIGWLITHAVNGSIEIGISSDEMEPIGDVLQFKQQLDDKLIEMTEGRVVV